MINLPISFFLQDYADRVARVLYRHGFTGKQVTVLAIIVMVAMVWTIGHGYFLAGLALILLNRFLDAIDSALTAHHYPAEYTANTDTDFRTYIDILLDYLFYAAVPLAFAIFDERHNGLASAFIVLTFMTSAVSFLSITALAGKRGIQIPTLGPRAFLPLPGLPRGIEVLLFFVVICLFASFYDVLTYGFAIICWLGIIGRIYQAKRLLA